MISKSGCIKFINTKTARHDADRLFTKPPGSPDPTLQPQPSSADQASRKATRKKIRSVRQRPPRVTGSRDGEGHAPGGALRRGELVHKLLTFARPLLSHPAIVASRRIYRHPPGLLNSQVSGSLLAGAEAPDGKPGRSAPAQIARLLWVAASASSPSDSIVCFAS